jgi:hypothetical protein
LQEKMKNPNYVKLFQKLSIRNRSNFVGFYFSDIVDMLEKKKISKVEDFAWVSNLRYYLTKEGDDNQVSKCVSLIEKSCLI